MSRNHVEIVVDEKQLVKQKRKIERREVPKWKESN
jgi:hypothetical protein